MERIRMMCQRNKEEEMRVSRERERERVHAGEEKSHQKLQRKRDR